jgi:hypothetical protein
MIANSGNAGGLCTLCEAKTRSVNPLVVGAADLLLPLPLPQPTKLIVALSHTHKSTTLFKREAPNDMKNEDLSAK